MGNISQYLKKCEKNVPGNRATVYLTKAKYADSLTVTATGKISALVVTGLGSGKATGRFRRVQADLDSVKFTNEGGGKNTYRETQALEMIFSKKSNNLVALKDNIADALPCGLIAIRVDGNGRAWLSGWNQASKEGTLRSYNEMECSFDSGTNPGDEDGNRQTIILKRSSGHDELPFGAILNAGIIKENSASADFIKFS